MRFEMVGRKEEGIASRERNALKPRNDPLCCVVVPETVIIVVM